MEKMQPWNNSAAYCIFFLTVQYIQSVVKWYVPADLGTDSATFQFGASVCSKPLEDFSPGSSGNQTAFRCNQNNRSTGRMSNDTLFNI